MDKVESLRRYASSIMSLSNLHEKLEIAMVRFGDALVKNVNDYNADCILESDWQKEMNDAHNSMMQLRNGIATWIHNHVGDAVSAGMLPTVAELEDRARVEAIHRKMMMEECC